MSTDFSNAQQQQQMLQHPAWPMHSTDGHLQHPLLSQQHHQMQWFGPQQYWLVPAGSTTGGPQAVPYAGSMVAMNSFATQAYAPQLNSHSAAAAAATQSRSDACPTAWAPMQQAAGMLAVPAPLGPRLYAPQPLYSLAPGVLSAPPGVRVQQQQSPGCRRGAVPQRSCVRGIAQQQQAPHTTCRHTPAMQPVGKAAGASAPAGAAQAGGAQLTSSKHCSSKWGNTARHGKGDGDASEFSPRLLTVWLKAATSPQQLLQLVQQHAADLNHIHLSAAYTQAVKLCGQGAAAAQHQAAATVQQQLLSKLHQLAVRLQQQCGARELANIIWSCGKLGSLAAAQLLLPLLLQASTLQKANPQQVSNVLWAAATLKLQLSTAELQQFLDRFDAVLPGANPQEVSNTMWAVATMGQQVPPQQLQPLLARFDAVLSGVNPQDVSNTLWAVATMGQQVPPLQFRRLLDRLVAVLPEAKPQEVSNTLWAVATMGQQVALHQLQPLLARLEAVLPGAKPQHVSYTLWAVATMGQQVAPKQLQQLLDRLEAALPVANPQAVSNTLWAVAIMGQQVAVQQLQLVLAAFQQGLPAAHPQEVANLVWACGRMQHLPLQLLQALEQYPHQHMAAANPQDLANMAWACGELGYATELLPGLLLQQAVELLQDGGTRSFTLQHMCNLCWSAAVLDLQVCVPQVLQLAAAASQLFSTANDEELEQLHQVHLWLLDSQLPTPGQGLSGVLTQQQLEQCRASWEQSMFARSRQQSSHLQQSVYAAVLHLPPGTLQQQPLQEQPTADKSCLIDIAAVTASGVKLAIEVEGPYHYVQPGHTLTGPTLFRNRALAARGYALVSIPYWEWRSLHSTQKRQQYLLGKLHSLGG